MLYTFKKLLLKPIFDVLAKPGLQAPHEGYEVELMLAGKKPAMITGWPLKDTRLGQYTKLQPFIDCGDIVVIGTQSDDLQRHIICRPERLEDTSRYVGITRKFDAALKCSNDEINFYHDFRSRVMNAPTIDEFFERANRPIKEKYETDLLLKGVIGATVPIPTGISLGGLPKGIREKINSGHLYAIFIDSIITTQVVLSPRSFIASGHELFARYYESGEGYDALSPEDKTKRIGQLLGYKDNDTDFFLHKDELPKIMRDIMFATSDFRKYARAQSLLMEKPAPL